MDGSRGKGGLLFMANVFFCISIFVFVFLSMRTVKTVNHAHSKCIFVFVFVSMGTKRKVDHYS